MRKKGLLIEDDRISQGFLNLKLKEEGYEIHTARNGKEGLQILYSIMDLDFVITGIQLPKMSGFEIIKSIRSHPIKRIRNIPIIATSAYANFLPKEKQEELKNASVHYLYKPVNSQELIKTIEEIT